MGRAAELAELVGLLQSARQGQGGVVAVKADAGLGKSRLKRAVVDVALQLGLRVQEGAARLAGDRAYGVLAAVLRQTFGLGPLAPERLVRQVLLEEGVRLELRESDRLHLLNVMGLDEPGSPIGLLDGRAIRWNNMAAVRSVLMALARQSPQLIVLEDMHASDGPTREVIDYLAREIVVSRTLVLLLYRRGYTPPAYAREMVLMPISPEGSTELVRGLWEGDGGLSDGLLSGIVDRAEGNPLYVEEAVRLVAEREGQMDPEDLPDTLDGLLQARICTLPPQARHAAETAATVGVAFLPSVLARIDSLWPHAIEDLEELAARGIVLPSPAGQPYAFRSSLMRDVIYASIDRERRRGLHGLVAGSLQALAAEGEEVPLDQLALHWARAGDRDRASASYAAAAAEAQGRHCFGDAERLYRAYLSLAADASPERIRARLELARIQDASGWPQEAAESLRQAVADAQDLGEPTLEAAAILQLATLTRLTGAIEEAEALLDEALDIHRRVGRRDGEAEVLRNMALVCKQRGRLGQARVLYDKALAIQRELQARGAEAMLLSNLAALDHEEGKLESAMDRYRQAMTLHRMQADRKAEAVVLSNIASLAREMGRVDEARDLYEAAIAVHREVGDRRSLGMTLYNVANLHGEQGRLEMAQALAEQALRVHREVGNRASEGATLGYLAAIHHEAGRLTVAQALYEEAIAIQRETQSWPFVAVNLTNLAELQHQQGRHADARPLLEEALQLYRRGKDRRGEAVALVRLAEFTTAGGDPAAGQEIARRALGTLRGLADLRGQALALVQMARAERSLGGDLGACEAWLGEASSILDRVGDTLEAIRCLVEQGHLERAAGRTPAPILEKVRRLVDELQLGEDAPARRAADALASAGVPEGASAGGASGARDGGSSRAR